MAGTATACGSDTDELADLPEAQLEFPGSAELASGGRGEVSTPTGPLGAEWWIVFGTDAPSEDVVAYFDQELVDSGWVVDVVASTTTELGAHGWQKGEYRFRLGFLDLDDLAVDGSEGFETVFDMRLQKPHVD